MKAAAERRLRERRHVHLGDRLLAIGRIRSGLVTPGEAARSLGVTLEEVEYWIEAHAADRLVSLDEFRTQDSPEMLRLGRRAQHLALLVAEAERRLRDLHREYIRSVTPSNDPLAEARESSKKFG
jgi:hypothetical protein